MFEAQILINDSANGTTVYSPWMQRGGDNAIFALDIMQDNLSSGKTFVMTVFTKAVGEAGDGNTASISITYTNGDGTGVKTVEGTGGMKDLVRYEFKFGSTATVDDQVMFRMLDPLWFDTVLAQS